jgi:NAD(P)-dependent dehydrogenase (short-subunit alcohol dehydrogenase family)
MGGELVASMAACAALERVICVARADSAWWRTADPIISVVLDRFGRLDIPVNNAGVFISKPFTDYTTVSGVNLAGFFWLTQRAIAEMVSRYGGQVVNVSATIAEVASSGRLLVLAALTKAAAATRSLAVGYASRGILVNAVASGVIQTTVHPANSYQRLGGRLPSLGRAGPVSDVLDGVLLLESSR